MSCCTRIPPSARSSPFTSEPSHASTNMVAVAGGDDIRCSPYACFGTQALRSCVKALEGRNACLLGHHALIVTARHSKSRWLAVEVETLAKMYVHALAIGEPPRLSEAEMVQVHEQIKGIGYGQAPDPDGVATCARNSRVETECTLMMDLPTVGRFVGGAGYAPLTESSLRALVAGVPACRELLKAISRLNPELASGNLKSVSSYLR